MHTYEYKTERMKMRKMLKKMKCNWTKRNENEMTSSNKKTTQVKSKMIILIRYSYLL